VGTLAGAGCASGPWWEGLTGVELWNKGRAEFEDGDYGDASETLGRLILEFPNFAQAAEAQFMLARSYFRDEQFISSQSEYTRFLDRYPAHPRAPEAALGVCRSNEALSPISQRDQTFTEQAIQVCRNVATDWAGTPQAEEAAQVVREMREKLAKKAYENAYYYHRRTLLDPALIYYQDLVEDYPETTFAPKALAGMIEIYTVFGYDDEVESARTRLLQDYPDSPEAAAISGDGEENSGDGGGGAGGAAGSSGAESGG
jgi:outer membrane protein assembly factor BamD